MTACDEDRPLAGVRVVELAVAVAGPAAAGCLCDWGADVVKVEHPGDKERLAYAALPGVDKHRVDQVSPVFVLDSRGKRSVALDLKEPSGRRALEALLAHADVFVSNLREAALKRLGLDCAALRGRFPRLVIGRVTGYGRYGPDTSLPAYEPTAFWARSGVAESHRSYDAERPPMLSGALADHSTGAMCAGGIAAALFRAQKTGKGSVVDASLMRTALYVNGWANQFALSLGGAGSPHESIRAMRPYSASRPYWGQGPLSGIYRASDGKSLYIKADARNNWKALCEAVGRPELVEDARFKTPSLRRADVNGPALHVELEAMVAQKPRDYWIQELQRCDVVCAPFQSPEEVVLDPQVTPALVEVPGYAVPVRTMPGPVDVSAGATGQQEVTRPRGPVPALGEHTEEVLREAGVASGDIAAVIARFQKGVTEEPIFRGRL